MLAPGLANDLSEVSKTLWGRHLLIADRLRFSISKNSTQSLIDVTGAPSRAAAILSRFDQAEQVLANRSRT
jgi:hypothetical protein